MVGDLEVIFLKKMFRNIKLLTLCMQNFNLSWLMQTQVNIVILGPGFHLVKYLQMYV